MVRCALRCAGRDETIDTMDTDTLSPRRLRPWTSPPDVRGGRRWVVLPMLLGVMLMSSPSWSSPSSGPSSARKSPQGHITVDVQKAELVHVVRLLASVGDRNVVVGEGVKGTVSVKLRDVHWRHALDVVLRTHGYGVVDEDGILLVLPQAQIDAEASAALDRATEHDARAPLTTRMIQVNNARAKDLAVIVKPLLSPRGRVSFDERTNIIIITDVVGSGAWRAAP